MKNKGTKQKGKKKGGENEFGCDLIEHLQNSGHDVPQVLRKCAEFIEEHGIVDGIYRLSGVTSNIQRLRQEFSSEACPDLTKEVYLQDIHCVGSLCKLYFRELPNPLLTYELYSKFTEAALVQGDHERLLHIQRVIKQLPKPHFRTLEYLTKHLAHLATLSTRTNMHTRNLALVWAPNLLRSRDIETLSGNGDMAFQEVRIQQSVVEFILNHTDQIFNSDSVEIKPREGLAVEKKYATLPISGQCGPMKLMSLEEAQARSLSPNHPVHRERQRENSLPDTSSAAMYHTVIDVADSKRKFSGKSKKWKSIFNLGKSVDSKGKLSRNGSVFIRAQGTTEKAALRPSRSMESLCSLPTDDDRTGNNSPTGPGGVFVPDVKSRTLGSDSLYDLSEHDQNWEFKGKKVGGATGGWSAAVNQKASSPPPKTLPEQLKVFKGDDVGGYKPTSPKNRRMLYSGSTASSSSSSRPSFPGSFFPLESSPRHQRRAVNISEPFAVSVPLRVSAVISSNSTPCRGHAKDKANANANANANPALKPCRETPEQSSNMMSPNRQEGTDQKNMEETASRTSTEDSSKEAALEGEEGTNNSQQLEQSTTADTGKDKETTPPAGQQENNQPAVPLQGSSAGPELWSDLHQELKITEPEIDLLDETFRPVFYSSKSTGDNAKLTMDVKSKRSRSSPSLTLLCRDQTSSLSLTDPVISAGSGSARKQPSESDITFSLHKISDIGGNAENVSSAAADMEEKDKKLHQISANTSVEINSPADGPTPSRVEDSPTARSFTAAEDSHDKPEKPEVPAGDRKKKKKAFSEVELVQRLSLCLEERRKTMEIPTHDDDDELDLVEPWEDLSSSKQWVTSPLHSPDLEKLFSSAVETSKTSLSSDNKQPGKTSLGKSTERFSGNVPQTSKHDVKTIPNVARVGATGKSSTNKQKGASSQRFYRQMSYDAMYSDRREENSKQQRPFSLNLDLGHRCIRDISNTSEFPSCQQRGLHTSTGAVNNGPPLLPPSELELFLGDRQAPLRRNSAPVSVSSVRTAFMIKTSQARAVPVVPPKVQYSQIPHSRQDQDQDLNATKEQEKDRLKNAVAPPPTPMMMSDLKEELENKEPAPKRSEKPAESTPDLPVITRRHPPSLEVFVDCPRPNRPVLQRPSFRNRKRPQSLILLSPPFPIMDYPPAGDDGKLLTSIRSLNDAAAVNAFSKEMAENFKTPDAIGLQSKMTMPKSGQRLETSTSCFYQPQRRSMIFDSRSHRQIE